MRTKKDINTLTYDIISAAIQVHKTLGPGLMENVYEACLCEELDFQGLSWVRQQTVPITYRNKTLHANLRFDILVEDQVIVEVKAVDYLLPVFEAQILSYMALLNKPKGILINFHSYNLVQGSKQFVNHHYSGLSDE